jgi:hypothetical protein
MCDCLRCGAWSPCDNAGCSNNECRDCQQSREDEAREALGADPDLPDLDFDVAGDPRRI